MRIVAMLAVLAAAGAAVQAPAPAVHSFVPEKGRPGAPPAGPPFGVVRTPGPTLSRLDALTLEPTGTRVPLGRSATDWAYDPGGGRLVVGSDNATLRFVDLGKMRVLGDVALAKRGRVGLVAWLWPRYVIAVYSLPGRRAEVTWVDPVTRRVVQQRGLDVMPWTLARSWDAVALLLPPRQSVGSARVAIADAAGRLRIIPVPRIQIGTQMPRRPPRDAFRRIAPGLALDPASRRVFVFGTAGVVAEIQLSSLAVSYHSTERRQSFFARLGSWLVPTAAAKSIEGSELRAQWLGNGIVAVAGSRAHVSRTSAGARQINAPAGLRLVDTRTWTQRTLDERAGDFAVAGDLLLGFGVRAEWGGGEASYEGMGVVAYGPDGTQRFEVLAGVPFWSVQATTTHAYAWRLMTSSPPHVAVLDLATGTLVQELALPRPPRLLLGEPSFLAF